MVSTHTPLHRRRSINSKMTPLSATAEFWRAPAAEVEVEVDAAVPASPHAIAAVSDELIATDEHDLCSMTMTIPAAHHQLLSHEQTSFTGLTGYDHTASSNSILDDDDDNDDDGDNNDIDSAASSYCCRQKLSAVKQQGGGSWLLGFARLNNNNKSDDDKPAEMPGLVRDSFLESDEDSSTDMDSDDDSSLASSSSNSSAAPATPKRAGVSFSESVKVQPIYHSSVLSPLQRRKMYATSFEVRQNKIRNKREYRYDGYDWRNVTEEWEMGVDMVTGELVHPAHGHHMA
eukprot:642808_1